MQVREKVGKPWNTVFFQCFVAPEGRKVGSLKRRVRSHLARWEMKNCTPLWREAHLEVKSVKAHHVRTTFGSWDVEKVHAVVARSTLEVRSDKTHHSRSTFGRLRVKGMWPRYAIHQREEQKCALIIWACQNSCPNVVTRFVRFYFEMCFAPQRRALFRYCNF